VNDFKDEEFRAEIFKLLGFAFATPFGTLTMKFLFEDTNSLNILNLLGSIFLLFLGKIFIDKGYEIMRHRAIKLKKERRE
jgi:hypothetical protein